MGLSVQKGTLAVPGATGPQTVNLDGAKFSASEPLKAIVLWFNYSTAAEGLVGQDNIWSLGFGTYRGGAVQQAVTASFDDDALGTGAVGFQASTADIIRGATASGTTIDYEADLASFGDASFTLNWTNLPTKASTIVHFLALGGSDITDAEVLSFTHTANSAAQNIPASAGFGQPDLIFQMGGPWNNASTTTVGVGALGVGKSATERRAANYKTFGGTAMNLSSIHMDRFIVGTSSTPTLDWEAELDDRANWPADGFRVQSPNTSGFAFIMYYLLLKGTFTSTIGSGVTPTAAAPQTQNLALAEGTPKGAILFGTHVVASASIVTAGTDLGGFWLGATDGVNEGVAGIIEEDANTAAICGTSSSTAKTIQQLDAGATTPTLTSEADATISGADVVLNWNDTDTVARAYSYVILGQSAPAGTPFAESVADTAGITDAVTPTRSIMLSLADGAALADSASAASAKERTLSDSAGVVDAVAAGLAFARALDDAAALTDLPSPVYGQGHVLSLGDSAGIADSASPAAAYVQALADSGALTDSTSIVRVVAAVLADAAALTDATSVVLAFARALDDAAGVTDETTPLLAKALAVSIDDAAGIGDAASVAAGYVRALADAGALTDSAAVARSIAAVLADAGTLTDATSVVLAFARELADAAALTDETTPLVDRGHIVAIDDGAGIVDATSSILGYVQALADAGALADSVAVARALAATLADAAAVTDSVAVARDLAALLADTAGIVDATSTAAAYVRGLADAGALTDSAAVARAIATVLADAAGLADAQALTAVIERAISDTAGITDSAETTRSYARAVADALAVSDAQEAVAALLQAVDDVALVGDEAETSRAVDRLIADNAFLADSLDGGTSVTLDLADEALIGDGKSYTDLPDGAIGYWRLEESSGSGVAVDELGNLNGTHVEGAQRASGVPSEPDSFGRDYDGSNDRTTLPNGDLMGINASKTWAYECSLNLTGMTIHNLWAIGMGQTAAGSSTLVGIANGPTGGTSAAIGHIRALYRADGNATPQGTLTRTVDHRDGNWHHCVVWMNEARQMYLQVDGEVIGPTGSLSGGTITITRTTIGGLTRDVFAVPWNGGVDDVIFYDRDLTLDEAQERYQLWLAKQAGLETSLGAERDLADSASIADAVEEQQDLAHTIADAAAIADALAASRDFARSLDDALSATDATSRSMAFGRTLADAAALADAAEPALLEGGKDLTLDLADEMTAADAVLGAVGARRTLADAAAATDALEQVKQVVRSLSDGLAVGDAIVTGRAIARELADEAVVLDAVLGSSAVALVLDDALVVVDDLEFERSHHLSLADLALIADAIATDLVQGPEQEPIILYGSDEGVRAMVVTDEGVRVMWIEDEAIRAMDVGATPERRVYVDDMEDA